MYKDIETETSYNYLKTVISALEEPICMLGGWAIFFTVNEDYKKQSLRVYLGSRDIDLGFNTVTSFKHAASILEKQLNFKFISFRYYKNIHAETGKDLTEEEAKSLPQHMFFPMYVDPIMSYVGAELKTKLGFTPVDEPMLKHVFDDKESMLVTEFGKKLLLPKPEILLACKIKSVINRNKQHKRYKDICDITALCLFSGMEMDDIIMKGKHFLHQSIINKFLSFDFSDDIIACSTQLGLEINTVRWVIEKIKGKS